MARGVIRPFTMADLPHLHRMVLETIDASYAEVYPPRAISFFKEHHSERKLIERSVVGDILVLTSERGGALLATGSLVGSEIVGVFVCVTHQRRGYGRTLMTRLEQIAVERGIRRLSLSMSLPSRPFYERLGYRVLGECVIDVGEGEYLRYWSGEKVLRT